MATKPLSISENENKRKEKSLMKMLIVIVLFLYCVSAQAQKVSKTLGGNCGFGGTELLFCFKVNKGAGITEGIAKIDVRMVRVVYPSIGLLQYAGKTHKYVDVTQFQNPVRSSIPLNFGGSSFIQNAIGFDLNEDITSNSPDSDQIYLGVNRFIASVTFTPENAQPIKFTTSFSIDYRHQQIPFNLGILKSTDLICNIELTVE